MRDVALIGPAGVGKDTVAQVLCEQHGFTRVAFADALKEAILKANPFVGGERRLADLVTAIGWDEAKVNPEVRRLLQEFGVAMRDVDSAIWVMGAMKRCDAINGPVVLTDVRFPNEVRFAKEYLGGLTVRLNRDGVDTGIGWRGHVSERALDDTQCDINLDGQWTPEEAARIVMMAASLSSREAS